MNTNETGFSLSKDYLSDSLYVWNHASITLIDIRHFIINPDEKLNDYFMPASGFIFTISNKAQIFLDDISYRLERFGLCHGGKGTMLSIL
jgi:iron complex transport system substrate-binding protein